MQNANIYTFRENKNPIEHSTQQSNLTPLIRFTWLHTVCGKNARGKNAIGKNVRGKIARGKNVRAKVVKIP